MINLFQVPLKIGNDMSKAGEMSIYKMYPYKAVFHSPSGTWLGGGGGGKMDCKF